MERECGRDARRLAEPMNTTSKIAIACLVGLALFGLVGAAHQRNYLVAHTGRVKATCLDDQFSQQGGAVGALVDGPINSALGSADPTAPDVNGTCYRKGHLTANANGEVTFTVSDLQTNVGLCVSQDSDADGSFCIDTGDFEEKWGCNAVTVSTAQGYNFGTRDTQVNIDWLPWGSGIVILLIGDESWCQAGIDDFGTSGHADHL